MIMAAIMPSTVSLNYLFLLQSYFKDDNPMEGMLLAIAIGAIIVISIFIHIFRHGISRPMAGTGKNKAPGVTPRKFNAFTLRRIASSYGLDREQTKLLEYVFRNDAVTDPERVMKTPAVLDRHFRRTFRIIEKNSSTDEDAQERLVKLFSLRNAIESSSAGSDASSVHLSENTPAILVNGKDSYPVKVLNSKGQNVVIEFPKNALGTPIRIIKGTKVSLSFFTKSSNGFSYEGTIGGAVNTDHGHGLQISHSGTMKPLTKRRFRRRSTDIKCEFYFVKVEEIGTGKKKTAKLVVDNRRYTGMIKDISIGGCSLKSSAPIQIGSRLKINVDYDDNYVINVLGQVIRTNRSSLGTIIHIKFLKVPRRAFNSISTLVFGYNDD
jgi:hypothetical protein